MLTPRDMDRIAHDIGTIISDWSKPIEIWSPLPPERQPGWNPIMHEVTGDIVYAKQVGIPADIRDSINGRSLSTNVSGAKYNGNIMLCIPMVHVSNGRKIPVLINDDSLVILDDGINDPWRIKSVGTRVGEYIIHISKLVGDEA